MNNDIYNESQRAQLIFLTFPIALAQLALFTVEYRPGQFAAILAFVELVQGSSAFGFIVDIGQSMNRFVNPSQLRYCLSKLCWPVANLERSHYRSGLHHAEL